MLHQRQFTNLCNTDNGDVDQQTIFHYRQVGTNISANYQGGSILQGNIIGKMHDERHFEMYYQHITHDGTLRIGHCYSEIERQNDGRLKIKEKWQWLNGDLSTGYSELIEITP